MSLKEVRALPQHVAVQVLAQLQDGSLTDAGHQVGRKIFREPLDRRENDEQDCYSTPRGNPGRGNDVLQTEERQRALALFAGESLIENGHNERADGALEQGDHQHSHCRQRKRSQVWL